MHFSFLSCLDKKIDKINIEKRWEKEHFRGKILRCEIRKTNICSVNSGGALNEFLMHLYASSVKSTLIPRPNVY